MLGDRHCKKSLLPTDGRELRGTILSFAANYTVVLLLLRLAQLSEIFLTLNKFLTATLSNVGRPDKTSSSTFTHFLVIM